MAPSLSMAYKAAKDAGRLCKQCGWIITLKWWNAGHKELCESCEDADRGVIVRNKYGYGPYKDEESDKTGEST